MTQAQITPLQSLRDIFQKYNTYLVDQWGVLHNGGSILPTALKTLQMLYECNKKVIIVSNSGYPREHTYQRMEDSGVPRYLYCDVMTSGDHLRHAFAQGRFAYLGTTPYFMDYDPIHTELGGYTLTHTPIEQASFVFCCRAYPGVESRMEDLKIALNRGLELICSNPDLYAQSPNGDLHPCPGLIAEAYQKMGGKVHMFGKPCWEMYALCCELADGWNTVIAVGDSLAHDIKGANNFDIPSVFITSGIHNQDIHSPQDIQKLSNQYNAIPTFSLEWF